MKGIHALRERRDALAQNLANLVDKDKTPEWKPEHQAQYDAAMSEIGNIDGEIKRHNDAMAAIGLGAANGNGDVSDADRNAFTRNAGNHGNTEESRALRAYFRGGFSAMAQEDLQRLNARVTPEIRAAMSTTTGSEGGFTVATEYYRQLTEALKSYGGIRSVANIMPTGTGAQMNFPTADATTEEGEIVGQNVAVSNLETAFANLTLDVYKYSSKSIALPFELIQDSMFDLDAYIRNLLATRLGRITAKHFTTGTGSSQPRGLVTASSVGKTGATGTATSITYDDLVDLEHSVDPIYRARAGAGYMLHDQSLKALRKIKDTQGRPVFVPGYEMGNPGGAPDRIMGHPVYISQEMPQMAANAKSVLFGDFKSYTIREVMDLTLFRMTDSAYTLKGQVGFVAFNRQGGNLIDVGGAVKAFQNSAT